MDGPIFPRASCTVALLFSVPLLFAQVPAAPADSLKAVIAEQRSLLAQADSSHDGPAAFEARMRLAELTGRSEATALLGQAAALADSLDRPDLGALAHRTLARRLATSNAFEKAYAEALVADSLQSRSDHREAEQDADLHAQALRRADVERDSVMLAATDRERRMAQALVDLQQKTDAWRYAALAALLIGMAVVVGLMYRMGRAAAKLRGAIAELRGEIEALKARPVRTPPPPPVAGAAMAAADAAMLKVAGDKFRQDAPERLSTLQEARRRGDTEKVLRVLATLRPQLLARDAERFGPLIASLRAPDAPAHAAQWNADLDRLEAAVKELAQPRGQ
jgi:hypothetical protein